MQSHQNRVVLGVALCLAILLLTSSAAHAQVISGPTLTMDPNNQTPLAGVVELETSVPVLAQLTITDGTDLWTVNFPDPALVHYLPVLGLKSDRTYTVDVTINPGGLVGTLFATTDPLPADFPTLVTTVSIPQEMEPGYTLLDCLKRDIQDPRPRFSVIVDSGGEVVWYNTARCWSAARQLEDGSIFYRGFGDVVIRTDLLGNEKLLVSLADPGIGTHHDLLQTPHGTYLSLTRQTVEVDEFPTSTSDPDAPLAPATLRDDSVVEFLPDGGLRREWKLVDQLDILRVAYGSLTSTPDGIDWGHANAVNYKLEDDSIIVSLRHQDAVFKFSRETGDVEWILAPHDNWGPDFQQFLLLPVSVPFAWQFHQHAPMWTANNRIVLFDNGNNRASPFDGNTPIPPRESHSRGVEYEIDEEAMEVRQVWEYGENIAEPVFAGFISDADWLEGTNNRLMTFAATSYVGGVSSADLGLGTLHVRVVETTGDLVPVKVFELIAYDSTGGRITSYRSERIPSLYPQRYSKPPNGVGDSVRMAKESGQSQLSWAVSPVDSEHDAADYYIVHHSASANSGFTNLESTANTGFNPDDGAEPLVFYKLVAANLAGTSDDAPAP